MPPTTCAAPDADVTDVTVSREALVRSHLPLVGHLVREMLGRLPSHVNRDDLVSAGMYALSLAATSFDPDRGVPFASLAAIRIRGALIDELRSMDWASRGVRGKSRRLETTRTELNALLGRAPRREEVAQALGIAVTELDALEADVHRASVLSLQALTTDNGADVLPAGGDNPESLLLKREEIGRLHDAIAELPERMRVVVQRSYFEQHKMTDIAADLGITESRVSQLRSAAMTMLRSAMHNETRSTPETMSRRAGAERERYLYAVESRSTLAQRLSATTLLGERRTSGHPEQRSA